MRRSSLAAFLLLLLVVGPVVASHVAPRLVSGASSCGPLSPGTVELVVQVPEGGGTVSDDVFSADLALEGALTDGSISFTNASLPVEAVFVAGTTGGNLYDYPEPVRADDGLVAPNGEPITDVSFCYVEGDAASGGGGGSDAGASPETSDAAGGGTTTPPTDTLAEPASPVVAVGLVAFGFGLALTGVALAAHRRPARLSARPVAPRPDRARPSRRRGRS